MPQAGNLRIDSHKLLFHPRRVVRWLDGETIYPMYMEISPTGLCNHRCTFCAQDFMGYRPRSLEAATLMERITELGSLGIGSIMYGGEGEPLLHPDIARIVEHTRASGIDAAMSTNGVLLVPETAGQVLPHMSWIKISINAGTPEGYAAIHRASPEDFRRVLANLASAARLIRENDWRCTLGAQAVLLPENAEEMELLAAQVKDAGAHYLVIKPYSQHPGSHTRRYAGIDYTPYLRLQERLERIGDSSFSVIFRLHTIKKMHRAGRGYGRCLALPFWSYIDSGGDVWACSSYLGDDRFFYGNIIEENFSTLWTGDRRKRSLDFVSEELDPEGCRMNCRMDEINLYLWELTHPSGHANFI